MKSLNVKLSLLQGAYWAAYCVLFAFMVPLFKDWGYSDFMIGVITTLMSLMNMVAQPIWGMYSDRTGKIKPLFISLMLVSVSVVLFLPLGGHSVWHAIWIVMLLTACISSAAPLIDAWTIKLNNDGLKTNYSLTRSMGSLVYALVAVGFGTLLDATGMWMRIPIFIAIIILIVVVSFRIQAPKQKQDVHHQRASVLRHLLQHRAFIAFVISAICINIGFSAMMSFYPILLKELGGNNTQLGLSLFIMAISQVPGMLIYNFLITKVSSHRFWLTFSLFFFGFKGMLVAFSPNLTFALSVQVFEALAIGLFVPAAMSYINEIVDNAMLTSATTIFAAIAYGFAPMVGNFTGGLLSELYGVRTMMVIVNCIAFLGFLWFVAVSMQAKYTKKYRTLSS